MKINKNSLSFWKSTIYILISFLNISFSLSDSISDRNYTQINSNRNSTLANNFQKRKLQNGTNEEMMMMIDEYQDDLYTIGYISEFDCPYQQNRCCFPFPDPSLPPEEQPPCILTFKDNNQYLYCVNPEDSFDCPTVANFGCYQEVDCPVNKYNIYKFFFTTQPLIGVKDTTIQIDYDEQCEDPNDPILCPTIQNSGCKEFKSSLCPFDEFGTPQCQNCTDTIDCSDPQNKYEPECESSQGNSTDTNSTNGNNTDNGNGGQTDNGNDNGNQDNGSDNQGNQDNTDDFQDQVIFGNPCYCPSSSFRLLFTEDIWQKYIKNLNDETFQTQKLKKRLLQPPMGNEMMPPGGTMQPPTTNTTGGNMPPVTNTSNQNPPPTTNNQTQNPPPTTNQNTTNQQQQQNNTQGTGNEQQQNNGSTSGNNNNNNDNTQNQGNQDTTNDNQNQNQTSKPEFNGTYNEFGDCICEITCNENQIKEVDSLGSFYCIDKAQSTNNNQQQNNLDNPLVTGSSEWVNPCLNPAGCVWSNSTLLYSFFIITNAVNLPQSIQLGTYKQPNPELENLATIKTFDPFGESWDGLDYTQRVIKSISENILVNFKRLYQGYDPQTREGYNFLTSQNSQNQKTNEITFVSLDDDENIIYTRSFINLYYQNFSLVSEMNYDKSLFLNGTYNNLEYPTIPILAGLSGDTSKYEYGFNYNKCQKMLNWKNYAQKKSFLIQSYQTRFKDIITKWFDVTNKPNYGGKFYNKTGGVLYNFTVENMIDQMDLVGKLAELFIADIAMGFKNNIKEFNPPSSILGVQKLYKFIQYDVLMNSMLHVYIAVQPLLRRIEETFIGIMNNDTSTYPLNSKMTFFSINDFTLAALYKLMNYDSKLAKNSSFLHYENNPFINYEYNIQVELWLNNTSNMHYVTFRENMKLSNQTLLFSKSWSEFGKWLSGFYNSIGYTKDEMRYFCDQNSNQA